MDYTLRYIPQVLAFYSQLETDTCRPRLDEPSLLATTGKTAVRAIRTSFCSLFIALPKAIYKVYTHFSGPNRGQILPILPLTPPHAPPLSTTRVCTPIISTQDLIGMTETDGPLLEVRPNPPLTRLQKLEVLFEAFKRQEIPRTEFETAFAALTEGFVVDYKNEKDLATLILIETMKGALAKSHDLSWIFSTDENTIASHALPLIFKSKHVGYYYQTPSSPSNLLIFAQTSSHEMSCYLISDKKMEPEEVFVSHYLRRPLTKENFDSYIKKAWNRANLSSLYLLNSVKMTLKQLDESVEELTKTFPYDMSQIFSCKDIQQLCFWLTSDSVRDVLIGSQLTPQFASFTQEDRKDVIRICRNLIEAFLKSQSLRCNSDLDLFFHLFSTLLLEIELDVDTARMILDAKLDHLPQALFEKCVHICSDSLKNSSFAIKLVRRAIVHYGYIPERLYTCIENLHQANFPWEKVAIELIEIYSRRDLTPLNQAKNAYLLLLLLNKYPLLWQKAAVKEDSFVSYPEKKIIQKILDIVASSTEPPYYKGFLATFSENLAFLFFEKGFTLTHPSQVATLHANLPKASRLYQYLSERKDLFPVEIASNIHIESLSPADLIAFIDGQRILLDFELRKSRSDPSRANISLIHKAQQLKKMIKVLINKDAASTELTRVYDNFVRSYDGVVDHVPILRLLRKISRELRAAIQEHDPERRTFSPETLKFLTIWDEGRNYQISYTDALSGLQQTPNVYKDTFLRQKNKVLILAHQFFTSPFWNTHNRRHLNVHGTKSATLHLLSKTPPNIRALRACGELVKSGTAPFAGELCGSWRGCNAEKLSFSKSTATLEDHSWFASQGVDGKSLIFCAPTHVLQSIIYALKVVNSFGSSTSYNFNESAAWNSLDLENITGLLKNKNQRTLDFLAITILRLRMINREDIPQRLEILQNNLNALAQKNDNLLKPLFEALTTQIPFQITPEDIPLIQEALPIVFATFSHFDPDTKVWMRETSLPTNLRLGKGQDVDVVFTTKEHIGHIEKTATPLGLEVHDIDELLFAEMLNMIEGSQIQQTVDLSTLTPEVVQTAISGSIIASTLPFYANPLPREPKAPQQASELYIGPQTRLERPFFGPSYQNNHKNYQAAIDRTESSARDIHGVMHMLRSSILAQVFQQILAHSQGRVVSAKERYLIAMAAAFHDSAREDDARDQWDELSAWNFREFLIKHNFLEQFTESVSKPLFKESLTQEEIHLYYNALAHKDSKEPKHNTHIRQAVHDADCSEIMRCVSNFDKQELCVAQVLSPTELDQLTHEIADFIRATEDLDTKLHYEYESPDPYNELVHELMNGPYPMLQHHFSR